MKKTISIGIVLTLVLSVMFSIFALPVGANGIDYSMTTDLFADQDIDVGDVILTQTGNTLNVEIIMHCHWYLLETHIEVGDEVSDIYQKNGNPVPGKFSEKETHDLASTYNVDFDVAAMSWPIIVAVHADVKYYSGNLLYNPGAETGDMAGWTHTDKVRSIDQRLESTGMVYPKSGSYFFDMTAGPSSYEEMSQDINCLTDFNGYIFRACNYLQTEEWQELDYIGGTSWMDYDYGEMIVTFYDSSDTAVGQYLTGPIGYPVPGQGATGYAGFEVQGTIPENTAYATYELKGYLVQGSYVNVFYDDLCFEIVRFESAWGAHEVGQKPFDGKNWATYIVFGEELGWLRFDYYYGSGIYSHDMWITDYDETTGDFSGHGGYPLYGPHSITWVVTGNIDGTSIEFTIDYDSSSYYVEAIGTITPGPTFYMAGTAMGYTSPGNPQGPATWEAGET